MAKNLSERLATWIENSKPTAREQNRATFIALREEIRVAVGDNWPLKRIWELLVHEKKVSFSYQTFRLLAAELIVKSQAVDPVGTDAGPTSATPPESTEPKTAVKRTTRKKVASGFTYDANSKDDIF